MGSVESGCFDRMFSCRRRITRTNVNWPLGLLTQLALMVLNGRLIICKGKILGITFKMKRNFSDRRFELKSQVFEYRLFGYEDLIKGSV